MEKELNEKNFANVTGGGAGSEPGIDPGSYEPGNDNLDCQGMLRSKAGNYSCYYTDKKGTLPSCSNCPANK